MTVGELVTKLQSYPVDSLVILAADAEGNNFSPVYDAYETGYVQVNNWAGETKLWELTDEDIANGYDVEDVCSPDGECVHAVVLWPTN